MPQLDFLAFQSQAFWLLLSLTAIIVVIYKYVLPDIILTNKTRLL